MPDNAGRDPEVVAATLSDWLATRLPDGARPAVTSVEVPAANGFSNETIMCAASWAEGGRPVERRLVFRVAPTRHLLFLDAEFSTQYKVMHALAGGGTGVQLPPLGWYEEDPSWLGVPFFTMEHVEGEFPRTTSPTRWRGG